MSSWTLFGQPASRVVFGTAAVAGSLAFLVYMLRKTKSEKELQAVLKDVENLDPVMKASRLKEEGNRLFAAREYTTAATLFEKAINVLENSSESSDNTLAVLNNNLSACWEYQDDSDKALHFASRAITLNPNYLKPYIRRSRVFKKQRVLNRCLWDLGKIVKLINRDRGSFKMDTETDKYVTEIVQIASEIVAENAEKLIKSRIEAGNFLPISQSTVIEWMKQTVHHDPLLNRMETLGENAPQTPLDLALWHLKRFDFKEVLPLAFKVAVDTNVNVRERMMGRLLAARIYLYACLIGQLEYVLHTANELWDHSDDEWKKNNSDLFVAIVVLQVYVEGSQLVEMQIQQNKTLYIGNADACIVLAIVFHRTSLFDKALEMLKLAKELEPGRQNIEYHEIATKFAAAVHHQDLTAIHNITAVMDRKLQEQKTDLPEQAVILAARIFMVSNNSALALETVEKHKNFQDKNNVGLQFLYTVLKNESNSGEERTIENFENELRELIKKDPYNYEIWRLIFRCHIEKGEFKNAVDAASKALLNTRQFEDFLAIYNDLILACALAELEFPTDVYPPYDGPEYIEANSKENVVRFLNSS